MAITKVGINGFGRIGRQVLRAIMERQSSQLEVVAIMVMNIHKYDHTKGSKAFSFISIVAKN